MSDSDLWMDRSQTQHPLARYDALLPARRGKKFLQPKWLVCPTSERCTVRKPVSCRTSARSSVCHADLSSMWTQPESVTSSLQYGVSSDACARCGLSWTGMACQSNRQIPDIRMVTPDGAQIKPDEVWSVNIHGVRMLEGHSYTTYDDAAACGARVLHVYNMFKERGRVSQYPDVDYGPFTHLWPLGDQRGG